MGMKIHASNLSITLIAVEIFRILFPGGALSFTDPKGYSEAGQYIYQIASELNDRGDYFPLWGTCLGFEFLTYVSANQTEIRANCNSYSQSVPLTFKTGFKASRMFGTAPDTVIKILQNEAVTANFHSFCVTEKVASRRSDTKCVDIK